MTTTKTRMGTKRYQFKPFEDETNLECICQLALRGREVGAYLLRNGSQYSIVFGFQAAGIHPLLSSEQAELALAQLEAGLKGFRPGDRLRIHLRSFANDHDRQSELQSLIDSATSTETQFLLMAQQRSIRDLTGQNNRQVKQIYLFATYAIEIGKGSSRDRIEQLLAWFVNQYETLKGMKERKTQTHYKTLLTQAFTDGYLHWEQQLNSRMGLQAIPMTADQLWGYLWEQFNHRATPPLPQCLTF